MVEKYKNKISGDLRDCSMAAADYGQKWAPGLNTIITIMKMRNGENDHKNNKRK